jgi:hypothetical protein
MVAVVGVACSLLLSVCGAVVPGAGASGAHRSAPHGPNVSESLFASADGAVYMTELMGGAPFGMPVGTLVNAPMRLNAPIVSMGDEEGLVLAAADGGVFTFDGAPFYGSLANTRLNAPIVDLVPMATNDGYFLVGADGGVFTFGAAPFFGSLANIHLNAPIVDLIPWSSCQADGCPDPSGYDVTGYYLVGADGGVFTFGDAPFVGSLAGRHLNAPIVATSGDEECEASGCWPTFALVGADGGVFTFGEPFGGSLAGVPLRRPIVAVASDDGQGDLCLVAADGGIFSNVGDRTCPPSLAGLGLPSPIVATE